MTHKKNSFEDTLHKSEEERHEYQVTLEALARTIATLDPLDARIESMSADERAAFRLPPSLGGPSRAVYERIIKKVYGIDGGNEVLRALQDNPGVAVPVVLARLRRTNDEWRGHHRLHSQTWREIDAKNFYKALDHQGISFKQNDKKNITAKHFVLEIESAKAAQLKARETEAASGSRSALHASRFVRPLGYQLQYQFADIGVLHDAVKLVFTFLDHSSQHYSPAERRGIERFLRSFVPTLFMLSAQEFNNACGPLAPGHDEDPSDERSASGDDEHPRAGARHPKSAQQEGVSAQDLRTRLLRTAEQHALDSGDAPSSLLTSTTPTSSSDTPRDRPPAGARADADAREPEPEPEPRSNAEDVWVRELRAGGAQGAGDTPLARRPFFAGTTFYTLLRLLQVRRL